MSSKYIQLLLVIASPIAILICHAVISRLAQFVRKTISAQLVCAMSICIAFVPLTLLHLAFLPAVFKDVDGLYAPFVYTAAVYPFVGYSYFHLFNMSETARRIRILYEVYTKGGLAVEEIKKLYESSAMLDVRLERLIALKQIKETNGSFVLDHKSIYFAATIINGWARIIGLDALKGGL